jgi:hypothetical protein
MSEKQQRVIPAINPLAIALENLSIETRHEFKDDEVVTSNLNIGFHAEVVGEDSFNVRFVYNLEGFGDERPSNFPYAIRASLHGRFQTLKTLSHGLIPVPEVINALGILYGALRGFILQATAMSMNGPFTLPSLVFNNLVMKAAADPASNVVPAEGMITINAPGAAQFFRFRFAFDDLAFAAGTLEQAEKEELLTAHQNLASALNDLAEQRGSDYTAILARADELISVAEGNRSALGPLLLTWARAIAEGLKSSSQSLGRISKDQASQSDSAADAET